MQKRRASPGRVIRTRRGRDTAPSVGHKSASKQARRGISQWLDARSGKHIWVLEAERVADWPAKTPWSSKGFALLFVADHVVDGTSLANTAVAQGLALLSAWGPGCGAIEFAFDDAIVGDGNRQETVDDVVLTMSHPDLSLEETLEFFLDLISPAKDLVATCNAWVVFAIGAPARKRVERALGRRRACRQK
jgi:hypothetical protein